ncbi:serine hydrolase domain-containing protein [Streptomyces sp. NBC_00829]|uniref:serine hydrolase domain-containing protein n=1 Tax=Streptomyces sp. NBC_00829 TaxID=2903679 RepID=UPI003870ADD5|nr:beta-lactamase family protein [Streptomyces sp. NBC_00829]
MNLSRRTVVTAFGLTAVSSALPVTTSAAADSCPADGGLQADVDAVAATGPVGVLARVTTPHGTHTARAGTAVLGTALPVPWQSQMRIGSTTKAFTATVALQLVGEGLLSLDDTVERWLPGLITGNGNDGRAITIRHLLQHTSGLYDYPADAAGVPQLRTAEAFRTNRFRTYSAAELIAIALRHPPDFPPGTAFNYSTTGYQVISLIIEKVTGESWEQHVTRRIIRPHGLRGTTAPGTDPLIHGPHPSGYRPFPDEPRLVDVTVCNQTLGGAGGALVGTLADVNSFFAALQRGDLLRPAEQAEMHRTVPTAGDVAEAWPGSRYGLGLMWTPSPDGGYWGHHGDTFGFHTRAATTPDGRRGFTLVWTGPGDEATDAAANTLATHALTAERSGGPERG